MQPDDQNVNKATEQRQLHPIDGHKPVFSNSAQVIVSNEEVTLQFAFIRPQANSGTLVGEVILTPQHAIRFNKALDETIKKHFTKHLPS